MGNNYKGKAHMESSQDERADATEWQNYLPRSHYIEQVLTQKPKRLMELVQSMLALIILKKSPIPSQPDSF